MGKYIVYKTNYVPKKISYLSGVIPMGYMMCVDYQKAKEIVNYLLEIGREIKNVIMGLDGDWKKNSNIIYDYLGFHKYIKYSHSCWAVPIILINYKNGPSEVYEVWKK